VVGSRLVAVQNERLGAFSVTFDITQCDWRHGSLAEPGAP
jgi:hypothetical protein